jgi:hypothetical protein
MVDLVRKIDALSNPENIDHLEYFYFSLNKIRHNTENAINQLKQRGIA